MAVYGGPNVVDSGLVLSLDAGNTRSYPGSGTTWTDISGQGNNGTLTNGPTYSSTNGGSLSFDGVDDHIPLTSGISVKTILTFIKLSTDAGGDYIVYGLEDNGRDNWFGINLNLVSFYGTQTADVNNFRLSGTTTVSTSVWYQIGCTIDGATAKVYVNGKEENSVTQAFTIGAWSGTPTIGRRGTLSQRFFPGNIATIFVYNRVLTEDEIAQNFNAVRGRFGL